MTELLLWALAVVGSALVLTQSSIFAPVREWFAWRAELDPAYATRGAPLPERISMRVAAIISKLLGCPMCSGFWIGLAWAWAFGSTGRCLLALGFAGSCSSAIGVALWLLLVEAKDALALWRYLNNPKE